MTPALSTLRCLDRTYTGTVTERQLAGVNFIQVTLPDGETVLLNPSEVRSITSLSAHGAKMAEASHTASLGRIQTAVAEFFGVALPAMLSASREARLVRARHVGMHLCRMAGYSSQTVSGAFRRLDHGTVLYASARVKNEIQQGGRILSGEVEGLRKLLNIPTP